MCSLSRLQGDADTLRGRLDAAMQVSFVLFVCVYFLYMYLCFLRRLDAAMQMSFVLFVCVYFMYMYLCIFEAIRCCYVGLLCLVCICLFSICIYAFWGDWTLLCRSLLFCLYLSMCLFVFFIYVFMCFEAIRRCCVCCYAGFFCHVCICLFVLFIYVLMFLRRLDAAVYAAV